MNEDEENILPEDKSNEALNESVSDLIVKYTMPENNGQIFARKYKMILSTKEEFKRIIVTN